ncbi:DUF3131 domain-containing protein [Octadecabacter sp. G9-8]|uniref:DUF3131 domain-containing protein n=1 Tax=Octadecabacter dasysiphoniae TaxID=2909341 RepID=A0ABS9CRK5_9RHOB|nr:DUF3131 domain-containing protein [Octadecabacter dasysiphoniae]MCF2869862.1 DUF3131 domain-containing protein [Octadecabacter dasysiphoniae]
MTLKTNLIKARSHIIFLVALGCGLALVTAIDRSADTNKQGEQVGTQMAQFEDITPLPLAITGASGPDDLEYAQIAWRYFENNTDPTTGLVNSTDNYPSTTMWETGSYFVAVMSANRLGVIDEDEAIARIDLALDTLYTMRLFDGVLPNKAYNVRTGELVNYANQPVERGLGWSALDIARMVAALGHVNANYPALASKTARVLERWDLSQMIEDGQLIGGNIADGAVRRDQEGRVGYEQYAAKAMMLFGFDTYRAYDAESHLMVRDVEGQPIPVDTRLHRNITPAFTVSEPYLFDGLEFGFDARSARFATSIYAAQEARYRNTGILTAVSESHIDVAPYFVYSSVWGGGAEWAVMTFSGDRMDSRRTVTTKVAFAWDALFGTDYTRELITEIAPLGDPARGWPEGIYEADGTTNSSITVNTNALVLAALAFRVHGPLIRAHQ